MNISEFIAAAKRTPIKKWSLGHGKYVKHIRAIDKWINKYSTERGIFLSNEQQREYPEVTGYWLETLLKWGYYDKAGSWYTWLISLQHKDGGWPDPTLSSKSYFFDSGQIARGLTHYAKHEGLREPPAIRHFLTYFDQTKEVSLIPTSSERANVNWHLTNLQVAWIVHKNWPQHLSIPWLTRKLKPYFSKWQVGHQTSHFDIYILEAMYELGIFPEKFKTYLRYFDRVVKKYGFVTCDRGNHAACYTATAQLAILYTKMGRHQESHTLMFKLLEELDPKKGNWPGSAKGGNYLVDDQISWGLKYFLDTLYEYSLHSFDLDIQGEWKSIVGDTFLLHIVNLLKSSVKPGSNVLDVGCGLGRYMKLLATNYGVYGLDISSHNVDVCKKSKLKAACSTGTEFLLPQNFPLKYDLIFSVEAFEHVVFPQNFLKQAEKHLKSNGKIMIVDKDLWQCLDYRLHPFESYYTKEEIRKLAAESKLTVEKFIDIAPFYVTILSKK